MDKRKNINKTQLPPLTSEFLMREPKVVSTCGLFHSLPEKILFPMIYKYYIVGPQSFSQNAKEYSP